MLIRVNRERGANVMTRCIKSLRILWTAHVAWTDESRILNWTVEWKPSRKRPRKIWRDDVIRFYLP